MGRIIVVTSGKGGTGKSSVTAALGTALAKRGKKVLLIDCDWGLRCLVQTLSHLQRLGDSWQGDSGHPCPRPRWILPACLT